MKIPVAPGWPADSTVSVYWPAVRLEGSWVLICPGETKMSGSSCSPTVSGDPSECLGERAGWPADGLRGQLRAGDRDDGARSHGVFRDCAGGVGNGVNPVISNTIEHCLNGPRLAHYNGDVRRCAARIAFPVVETVARGGSSRNRNRRRRGIEPIR